MKKVIVVQAPLDDYYKEVPRLKLFENPPTWLCQLIMPLRGIAKAKIIGNPHDDVGLIINKIKKENPDHVGISAMYCSQNNALKIAKEVNNLGSIVTYGGHNATGIPERILLNRNFIDYVVVGSGVEAFKGIVLDKDENKIPNLYYRYLNKVKFTFRQDPRLNLIYDLEDLEKKPDPNNPVVISLSKGCEKEYYDKACYECSIKDKLRLMNPKLIWEQINLWKEKYGIKKLLEGGDALSLGNFYKIMLENRPKELSDIVFERANIHPNQITQEKLDIMKKLNIKRVFVGIETYNDKLLKSSGRGYDCKTIDEKIKLVIQNGFELHVGFVYGFPDETKTTANKTYDYIRRLKDECPDLILLSSILKPFPGTEAFSSLLKNSDVIKEYPGLLTDDIFDYKILSQLHTKYLTNVDYDFLLKINQKTMELGNEGKITTFH